MAPEEITSTFTLRTTRDIKMFYMGSIKMFRGKSGLFGECLSRKLVLDLLA